ncbi:hypothetical protein HDV05_006867 [Chytridiales sp. JEL 0842]|nr:hypothetical protein HDV05_006867 [Chytridiales sp. JEL 0842]
MEAPAAQPPRSITDINSSKPTTSGSTTRSQFPINPSSLKSKSKNGNDSALSLSQRLSQSLGSLAHGSNSNGGSRTLSNPGLRAKGWAGSMPHLEGGAVGGGAGYSTAGTATPAMAYTYNIPPSTAGGTSTFGGVKRTARSLGSLSKEPTCQGMFRLKFCKREDADLYSVKFSLDEEYIAAGMGNSDVNIYSTRTNEFIRVLQSPSPEKFPCTSIAFRPDATSFKNRNVVAAAYADGRLIHWHATTGQLLSTIQDGDSQLNCVTYQDGHIPMLDIAPGSGSAALEAGAPTGGAGKLFATGGSDMYVRVYDSVTHKRITQMISGQGDVSAGHSSRVFSVKFHPKDPNLLISGGWDNTLQIWDMRLQHSVRSLYGPHICGDSIDFSDDGERIMTGSFSKENQIQVWSFKEGQCIQNVSWSVAEGERQNRASMIYSASYSHGKGGDNKYIVAGATGTVNEAVGMVQGFSQSVYSSVISPSEKLLAVGGAFKSLYVYDIDPQQNVELVY